MVAVDDSAAASAALQWTLRRMQLADAASTTTLCIVAVAWPATIQVSEGGRGRLARDG